MLKISANPYQHSLKYSLLTKPRGEVYGFIAGIFKRMEVYQTLGVTTSGFLEFLMDIEKGYNDNPYHSFYHAVDVTMVLYHMFEQYGTSEYIARVDIALALIAALCHDIGHVSECPLPNCRLGGNLNINVFKLFSLVKIISLKSLLRQKQLKSIMIYRCLNVNPLLWP
jgi:hypothetical protein